MNIVEPYARIIALNGVDVVNDPTPELVPDAGLAAGIDALRSVEWFGRISHRSEDAQTADSWDRFIRAVVLGHGDWSITEHVNVTVDFLVDRGITHEIVRHRIMAYTQESTRFVNYEKKRPPAFVMPEGLNEAQRISWERNIGEAEMSYKEAISQGLAPQIARSVFPNALASRLIATGNLRSWRHFLLMRTTKEAHPQMRQVTIPLLAEFKALIPILYEDIEPEARQIENMKKAR